MVVGQKRDGATTVSATMIIAHMVFFPLFPKNCCILIPIKKVGISIFATGGIGGVHREGENSMDVSADLTELGRTPVTVVCAGAKVRQSWFPTSLSFKSSKSKIFFSLF